MKWVEILQNYHFDKKANKHLNAGKIEDDTYLIELIIVI